jgi:uncharacterized protein
VKVRVFITGATGMIGDALAAALLARGDQVVALSRGRRPPPAGAEAVVGDVTRSGPWQDAVAGCDALIHLAGAPIAGRRWDAAHKRDIRDSRLLGTARVVDAIAAAAARADARPPTLLCASGADRYPSDESDKSYPETAPAGDSFLARVCQEWEEAAARAQSAAGARVASLRTGVVLGRGAGALAKLVPAFKAFVGGPLGSGRQWFPWVHLDDVVAAYLFVLDREAVRGPVNLVAPGIVRQRDFARQLGAALRRPAWVPVPALALRAAVGELAEYLLTGRRVVPEALLGAGYGFRRPDLASALAEAVGGG